MVDKTPQIYEAIHKVQSDLKKVAKDGEFDTGAVQYEFLAANDLIHAVRPLLNEHGIVMRTFVNEVEHHIFEAEANGPRVPKHSTHLFGTVDFSFISVKDGSEVTNRVFAEAADQSDKASRKLMTSATKIALIQAFVVETGEKDEHELDSPIGKDDDRDVPAKPSAAERKVAAAKAPAKPTVAAPQVAESKTTIKEKYIDTGLKTPVELNELLAAAKEELGLARNTTKVYDAVLAKLEAESAE